MKSSETWSGSIDGVKVIAVRDPIETGGKEQVLVTFQGVNLYASFSMDVREARTLAADLLAASAFAEQADRAKGGAL